MTHKNLGVGLQLSASWSDSELGSRGIVGLQPFSFRLKIQIKRKWLPNSFKPFINGIFWYNIPALVDRAFIEVLFLVLDTS
jgi:hypothetical protein